MMAARWDSRTSNVSGPVYNYIATPKDQGGDGGSAGGCGWVGGEDMCVHGGGGGEEGHLARLAERRGRIKVGARMPAGREAGSTCGLFFGGGGSERAGWAVTQDIQKRALMHMHA